MFRSQYRYPIVTGLMLAHYRTALTSWTGLQCATERLPTMPKRMLTLREDGGPDDLGVMASGFGVNLWADSAVDAKNLALDAVAATLSLPGVGSIKAIRDLVGAYVVDDDPAFAFGGKPLTHYYFSFDAIVKETQL